MADPGGPDESSPRPEGGVATAAPAAPAGAHLTRGFLFADLRDFTSYVDERGDHAGALLLDRYRTLVRGAIAASGGAEIKTEGDSFYVVFDSASAAVRCGQEIIAAAAAAPGEPIRVGVGVHAGETVETAEGFVGSAVNIAARLCAQARAGELVVSDTVRALTRTYLDVEFEPLGARRLKGVNDQIALFRVVPHGAGAVAPGRGRVGRRLGLIAAAAIAVVVLAGASVTLLGGQGASPTPSPTAGPSDAASPGVSAAASAVASAAVSPSGGTGDLSPAEQVLKGRIPSVFQPYCLRSSLSQGGLGGAATIQCILSQGQDGYGADTVWYDQFDTTAVMDTAIAGVRIRQTLSDGTCSEEATGVIGTWSVGVTLNGALGCYVREGAAWLVWTYRGDRIAVRATRRDGDVGALYRWWRDVAAYYLRAG